MDITDNPEPACDYESTIARVPHIGRANMANIIPLSDVDPQLVEELLDRAFDTERHTRTAYKIRQGVDVLEALSFAVLDADDMLVGTIQCWPVALTDEASRRHPMIMVGPVAILPEHQGLGYGKALMTACLAAIDPRAPLPQVMIGDQDYYGRFWGFTNTPTQNWQLPAPWDPNRLLVRSDNLSILPQAGNLGPWL